MRAFAFLFFLSAPVISFAAESAPRPNIVFVFADDWGWGDLSCRDHPFVKTPHIDRIAAEGTDFRRFTVASGVCSPSRTAVMTGHFPARYAIDGHFAWVPSNAKRGMPDWLDPAAPSLPRMLQDAGYATAHYGKWHLANNMIPDSPLPEEYGYDDYGAFNCAGEQMPWYEDAERAVAFIEKSTAENRPFFINLWLHEPHTPFHTIPRYEWRFRHLENREDQIYASVLSHADDRVGLVLDALDRLGQADNTLVIFSSDNGPARAAGKTELELMYDTATGAGWNVAAAKGITGGRRGYKASLFDGGIGVPFLARWPGRIPAGEVDEVSLISAVDLLPTFCALAGAPMPEGYRPDGVSIVAVLTGQLRMPNREKALFWKAQSPWPPRENRPDHWISWAVLHGRWKLVANRDLDHVELYDIGLDIGEEEDLADARPEVTQRLMALLLDWRKELPEEPPGNVFSAERETRVTSQE